jgi:hypothetical protein
MNRYVHKNKMYSTVQYGAVLCSVVQMLRGLKMIYSPLNALLHSPFFYTFFFLSLSTSLSLSPSLSVGSSLSGQALRPSVGTECNTSGDKTQHCTALHDTTLHYNTLTLHTYITTYLTLPTLLFPLMISPCRIGRFGGPPAHSLDHRGQGLLPVLLPLEHLQQRRQPGGFFIHG